MAPTYASSAVVAVGAGASPTATLPSGTVAGDLLVAYCWANTAAGVTWTPPTGEGWVADDAVAFSGTTSALFHRVATSSEAGTYLFTRSSTGLNAGLAMIRINAGTFDPTTPIAASKVVAGVATTTVLSSLAATAANTLLLQTVTKAGLGGTTFTPPGTATSRDAGTASGVAIPYAIGDEVVGSGATGTRTWTSSLSSASRGGIIAINAATSVVVTRTGTASLVLAATSTSHEVEKSAATASTTLAATALARAVVIATAATGLTLTATAVAVPVAPRTGTATLDLTATGTGTPYGGIHTRTGTASINLDATADASTGSAVSRSGTAGIVLAGTATARVVYTRTGLASISLGTNAPTVTVHPRAGLASLGINQTNVVKVVVIEVRTGTATLGLGASANSTAVEIRNADATVKLGIRGRTGDLPISRVTITEHPRTHTITDLSRATVIADHPRTVTVKEAT